MRALGCITPNPYWLPDAGIVPLTDETCPVGHDGWGDGRLGDCRGSHVMLNDFGPIAEFGGFDGDTAARLAKLHALGDAAAAHFRAVLPDALTRFRHVVVATHVPPLREACWHEGKTPGEDWLPSFSCKAVGDVLAEAMSAAPNRTMTVLCGHTHGGGEGRLLSNLRALTGGAKYGLPEVQDILAIVWRG